MLKEKIKRNLTKNKAIMAMLHVAIAAMTGNKVHSQNVMQIEATKLTKNAFLGIVIMSVMSLVVGSVFLYIGIFVNTTVYNAIPVPTTNTTADLEFNATMAGVKTNVNTAFTLGGIIMIVIGAAGIISVLLGMVPNATRS
ncbi:MAG: hypothetical protein C3F06_02420 [Candidatus Methanoperedenaceae archaeon]|nr:MAG: hypothetical protein C3F06_02420 [Candidatus Methanoperedenaceae archaeon]